MDMNTPLPTNKMAKDSAKRMTFLIGFSAAMAGLLFGLVSVLLLALYRLSPLSLNSRLNCKNW